MSGIHRLNMYRLAKPSLPALSKLNTIPSPKCSFLRATAVIVRNGAFIVRNSSVREWWCTVMVRNGAAMLEQVPLCLSGCCNGKKVYCTEEKGTVLNWNCTLILERMRNWLEMVPLE